MRKEPQELELEYADYLELFHVKQFISCVRELGLELTPRQIRQYYDYNRLLYRGNSVMNLTGITEPGEVAVKHYLDSLLLLRYVEAGSLKSRKVLDVGSGAGIPGIPLAIALPETNFVLMDSTGKRVEFLKECIESLGLTNVCAVKARAEELAGTEHRESYDLVTARAVAAMRVLAEFCLPFVKKGGQFAAYKGGEPDEEMKEAENALRILGGGKAQILRYDLPGTEERRSLVLVPKEKETAAKYPRHGSVITSRPL